MRDQDKHLKNLLEEHLPITQLNGLALATLKLNPSIAVASTQVALENLLLMSSKQDDYGPNNISAFGEFGVLVRLNDKFERLKNLMTPGKRRRKPKNEAINDTLRDISNYANIMLMLRRGQWPGVPTLPTKTAQPVVPTS